MTPEVVADLLARCAPFDALDGPSRLDLAQTLPVRRLRGGQVLFAQGDPGSAAYVVAEGAIKLSWPGRDGEELVVRTVRAGELFGELALLDGEPRSAWAEAIGSTQLVVVAQEPWQQLLRQPSVVRAVLADLAGRVRVTTQLLAEHALVDLTGRVAAALLRLAATHGTAEGEAIRIAMPVTQSGLAATVAASRQSVNQVLRAMERKGDIAMEDRVIVLVRPDVLRRRAAI